MRIEEEIKQKAFSDLNNKLAVNIMFTHGRLFNMFEQFFGKFNLTAAQYNVLRILRGQYPDSVSVGTIKERVIDRNSDISRIADRLAAKNLILEIKEEKDRRKRKLLISNEGLNLLTSIDSDLVRLENDFFRLSDEEKNLLNNLLDKCRIGLQPIE